MGLSKDGKNQDTLECDADQDLLPAKQPAKKGHPKGSLNKSTIAFMERMAREFEKERRGRGSPAGSRNKWAIELESTSDAPLG